MGAGFNKKLVTEYLEPRMQNWNFHSKLVPRNCGSSITTTRFDI